MLGNTVTRAKVKHTSSMNPTTIHPPSIINQSIIIHPGQAQRKKTQGMYQ